MDEAKEEMVKELHVMPMDDVIQHEESELCSCDPYWDPDNKKEFESGQADKIIFVHNRIKDMLN